MRNTMTPTVALMPLALLAFCCGCQQGQQAANGQTTVDDTPVVKVVRPTRTTLSRTTTQPATVHAYHRAELFAKVPGYLTELKADIGQTVDEHFVLGVIDVPEMEKAREKQDATIRQLQADERRYDALKNLAEANVTAAEAFRKQADAEVKKTDAQLAADESEFKRMQKLAESKAVTDRLVVEARKRFEAARAGKTAAKAALKSATVNVTVAKERVAVAIADREAAGEATKVAEKQLEEMVKLMSFAELKAPFKGIVTERNVDLGDLVRNIQTASNSNGRPLFTISQLDDVRVRVAVPEDHAPWANEGDEVTLRLRSLPDRPPIPGKIDRIAHSLDEGTRTMLVEIDLPNPDGVLLPGMYGEATIVLETRENVLMLPATAVRSKKDEDGNTVYFVYVLDAGDKVSVVTVTTGADDGKQIEITSELDDDARIVDSTIGTLSAGQRVRVDGGI